MYDTEISNTRVNKKMVYLSACTTGLGEVEKGEGLRSLCKSFLEAGVPTVVQSQWEVNAKAGTEITGEFYRLMSQGLPAIEALRQAKLNYWKNANLSEKHPYYWAAFVLVGDDLQYTEHKLWIYLSLGLGLLVFLFINYLIKKMKKRNLVLLMLCLVLEIVVLKGQTICVVYC
ncbi:MAG: CHAT domain-containing protein [Saprospiraceae bacterium]|nr:CHAT domain-containing protein [Saprospiraceae bacterium]